MRALYTIPLLLICSVLLADLVPSKPTDVGSPLTRTEKLKKLTSSDYFKVAGKILKSRGYGETEVAKALEEMPERQLDQLLAMVEMPRRGGWLDLLLFVLVVVLIVWLILILVDPYYRRYY